MDTRSRGKSARRSRNAGQPTVCAVKPRLVVQAHFQEQSSDAQRQHAVRAGPGREVHLSALGAGRSPRIDDDELATFALRLAEERHEVRPRADRVVPPQDDELAVPHVLVGRAPASPERGLDRALGGGTADAAFKLTGAKAVPETAAGDSHLNHAERAAVAIGQDRLGSALGR